MEYNTGRTKLINGEYGRHIQKMIEYAMEIKDRDLRNQQAKAIVRAMSCFLSGSKETEDYWHRLWDQLFVMSGYKLDVESPFPKPTPPLPETRPQLKYPKHEIRFRPYGLLIENIIRKITTEEDTKEKEQAIVNIANHLKKQYLNWNRDSVSDVLIFEHLNILSEGKLQLDENFRFSSTRDILNDLASTNSNNGKSPVKKNNNKKKNAAPVNNNNNSNNNSGKKNNNNNNNNNRNNNNNNNKKNNNNNVGRNNNSNNNNNNRKNNQSNNQSNNQHRNASNAGKQ
ncbi:MAG: DUF4290 domain-containing protein [Bacteroidales bacterium]|jgi:hypothetical protein|nr:DUF4290 domain-containing protein [Bacteroidales bacterium]